MPLLKQNLVEQDTSYKEKYVDASEYDCLLEDLNAQDIDLMNWMDDNNYLTESDFQILQEMIDVKTTQWRASKVAELNNDYKRFNSFITQHIQDNTRWLELIKPYVLNQQQYPVKQSLNVKNSPDYKKAIQRVSNTPMASSLSSVNIDTIQSSTGEDANGVKKRNNKISNMELKRSFAPGYNGKTSFINYAKNYYYGNIDKMNYNSSQLQELLPKAYSFITNINQLTQAFLVDKTAIEHFINRNETTGEVEQTPSASDLAMIQNAQGVKQSNTQGMSTSATPKQESLDYNQFMNKYFSDILSEDSLNTAAKSPSVSNTNQVASSSVTQGANHSSLIKGKSTLQKSRESFNKMNKLDTQDDIDKNKAKEESKIRTERINKKRIACGIIRDAFAAKLEATCLIYRDLIILMYNHARTYNKRLPNLKTTKS